MGLNIYGINGVDSTTASNNTSSASRANEPEFLWDEEITSPENTENNTQLNDLQIKLQELEDRRQKKLDEKNRLLQQKNVIASRRAAIEAEIKANEETIKANNDVIIANQQKIETQQKEIEKLQQQYNQKCEEAEALNEQINERVAQILAKSEQDVQEATEKIRKATEEAYAKVESGEITEDEVAQYVSNKAGISNLGATNADFAAINAMNNQMRILTTAAQNISNQMVAAADLITVYQANISSALASNQELASKNAPLVEQLKDIDTEEKDIDAEIARVDQEIAKYDAEIAEVKAQMEAGSTTTPTSPTTPSAPNTPTKPTASAPPTTSATTKVDSSNPFLAISYNNASFTSMVAALDAMVKANEQTITNAQATVAANNGIIRNIFQEQMKK